MDTIYKGEIFRLAEGQINQMFYNSSPAHAAIVHQAIAKYAQSYIYIFSNSLCTEISNNDIYCQLIDNFLSKDKSRVIRILLTKYSSTLMQKPIFQVLSKYSDQVSLKAFNGNICIEGKDVHFTIADDKMFRLETDIENALAYGNFNSPNQVTVLKSMFNKVFTSSLVQSKQLSC